MTGRHWARGVAVFSFTFAATILLAGNSARAAITVTPGWTFSVASQAGVPATGTHYHDDHGGSFGNPPDLAEVGSLIGQAAQLEECRGLTEFDLTGLSAGTATLQFRLLHPGGLFVGQNDYPFTGNIGVLGYVGNNADDVPDYHTAASPIGTFPTAPLIAGSLVSFDVTSIYNAQLLSASPALGFRLQTTPSTVTGGGAFTFDQFTLTVVTPEPTGMALIFGSASFALTRRRRKSQATQH